MTILTVPGLAVSLGGQNLSYTVIGSFPHTYYTTTLCGADISAFAGRMETLTFARSGGSVLDNIQFSSQPIPEPSVLSLLFVAGGVLASLRARRRTKPKGFIIL
ncbi:MAG: PEP-CTERM sorting domain-containing protein [Verrucomicrobiota bacterium]|nr:PEP-CTERM sorting domain-containing protein [Verrucomicrobiota bacterium]